MQLNVGDEGTSNNALKLSHIKCHYFITHKLTSTYIHTCTYNDRQTYIYTYIHVCKCKNINKNICRRIIDCCLVTVVLV